MKRKIFTRIYILIVSLFAAFVLFTAPVYLRDVNSVTASAETALSGDGTESSPYLIEDRDDFFTFISEVNGGYSFKGEYVSQTKDINFENIEMLPVGLYDSGNYFEGVYDGNGNKMYNLNINAGENGNAGLFATLGGSVRNLGLESGSVYGYCIGAFSSNASSGTAEIINCYSKINLRSVLRGGGIADNFAGLITNCVSLSFNNGVYANLCGYNGRIVTNCYTAGERINSFRNKDGQVISSSTISVDESTGEELLEKLNGGIFDFCKEKGDINFFKNYVFWTVENDGLVLSESAQISRSVLLNGDGSEISPYEINDKHDFAYLIYKVNKGESFSGKFFVQTSDINFGFTPMQSVGSVRSGNAFLGIYRGSGYKMYNYCIYNGEGENSGLFGVLGGSVMNLGMDEGYIFGNCTGGIAVNALYGYTSVFNCYSKAEMYGGRGGGIADNFSGSVTNCVSDATINGNTAPLAAYLLRGVNYSYSTGKIVGEGRYDMYHENKVLSKEALYTSAVEKSINYKAAVTAVEYYLCSVNDAAKWSLVDGLSFDGTIGRGYLNPKEYLKGLGSKSDPYLIEDVEDFVFFHDSVNTGTRYNGRYVLQTADLDFKNKTLSPIGLYDTGNYFYGTYDGNGYTINNLDIRQDYARAMTGLFGSLAGFIYNVGYVSGTVYGEIAAGLVNCGITAEGAIVNSYFTGDIYAYRASGITDSFRGKIINCWCDGVNLYNDQTLALNAIVATDIIHSFSTGVINELGYDFSASDSCSIPSSLISDERFSVILNAGCLYSARKNFAPLKDLSAWTVSNKKTVHEEKFNKDYGSYISGFKGLGVKWSPYRISSVEDLMLLQLITAAGEEYKNQYFIQTDDIDCSSLKCGIPIGELSTQVFYAEYDGQGYEISNLVLNSSIYDGSCAFIRTLGGTVKNLFLNACVFIGENSAGVAVYTDYLAHTRIINCIVTNSIIYGNQTSAGMVIYGRETRLYNCLYLSYDARSSKYLCMQADKLYGCYTNLNFHDENYRYVDMEKCAVVNGTTLTLKQTVKQMNSNIIALKSLLNENIVGEMARFDLMGEEDIGFNGFFRVNLSNLAECIPVLGYDILMLIFLTAGIVLIAGSVLVEIYLKKRIAIENRKKSGKGSISKIEEVKSKDEEKYYTKMQRDFFKAEGRIIKTVNEEDVYRTGARTKTGESADGETVVKTVKVKTTEKKGNATIVREEFRDVSYKKDISDGSPEDRE